MTSKIGSAAGLLLGLFLANQTFAAGGDATVLGPTYLSPIHPVPMNSANHASTADQATVAQTAVTAQQAAHAATADAATTATTATTAGTADVAILADTATQAQNALTAQQAITAQSATTAQQAQTAVTAQTAVSAQTATTATNTLYAWASGNYQVFPDPDSASRYAQGFVDAQNAIYLQSFGCSALNGGCNPNLATANNAWLGTAEWDVSTGALGGQAGAPCLSIYQEVHSSIGGQTCTLFTAAVVNPPTTTVVQGATYYVPQWNPGVLVTCAMIGGCSSGGSGGDNGGNDGSGSGSGGTGSGGDGGGSGGGSGGND